MKPRIKKYGLNVVLLLLKSHKCFKSFSTSFNIITLFTKSSNCLAKAYPIWLSQLVMRTALPAADTCNKDFVLRLLYVLLSIRVYNIPVLDVYYYLDNKLHSWKGIVRFGRGISTRLYEQFNSIFKILNFVTRWFISIQKNDKCGLMYSPKITNLGFIFAKVLWPIITGQQIFNCASFDCYFLIF